MVQQTEREDGALVGTVKWFDPVRGFGFVIAGDDQEDILLHANVLRNFGQSSIADGARIEITVQYTDRGAQAVEILSIEPPKTENMAGLEDIDGLTPEELDDIDFVPARIKWFDKTKGFGFANEFRNSDDIFVHAEILRRSGLSDLMPGEAVALKIIDGSRGKMAILVNAWESVGKHSSR